MKGQQLRLFLNIKRVSLLVPLEDEISQPPISWVPGAKLHDRDTSKSVPVLPRCDGDLTPYSTKGPVEGIGRMVGRQQT